MTPEELHREVAKFPFWYHKIDLGQGVVTPGLDFEPVWDVIRETRKALDYRGKKVLDLASFDGMWAFEAERLGAEAVVAVDSYYETFKNFLFCRNILDSKVIPYYNVAPHDLWNRLDVYLQEDLGAGGVKPYDRLFDIVQHLGLLYHLRDPLLTLAQSRSVVRTGGYLLIETAAIVDEKRSFMVFNGTPPTKPDTGRIYPDMTTWWAPTVPCLKEMLRAALFEPIEDSIHVLQRNVAIEIAQKLRSRLMRYFSDDSGFLVSRIALIARAVAADDVSSEYFKELARTYRNPFLVVEHLQRR